MLLVEVWLVDDDTSDLMGDWKKNNKIGVYGKCLVQGTISSGAL